MSINGWLKKTMQSTSNLRSVVQNRRFEKKRVNRGVVSDAVQGLESRTVLSALSFTQQTGVDNPLPTASQGNRGAPTLGDLDGDGDLDIIVGQLNGSFRYFQNTGTATTGTFVELTGGSSPVSSITGGWLSAPGLGDLDHDGDLDLVVGTHPGDFWYYKNTGTAKSPVFTLQTGSAKINFVIEYTDDFNQKRTVEKTIDVNVEEGFIEPTPDPNVPLDTGGMTPPTEETFLQKTWRFILGFLGLDSAPSTSSPDMQSPPTDFQSVPSGG